MNTHTKKIIAPVIVVLILGIYYVAIGLSLLRLEFSFLAKALIMVIPLLISVMLVVVLIERIKEIRSGEEDDLGKY